VARMPAARNISAAVPEAVSIRLGLPEISMVGFLRSGLGHFIYVRQAPGNP
jgi:hypothetical protein